MINYNNIAYFTYTFASRNDDLKTLFINRKLEKKISKILKILLDTHKNEIYQYHINTIKFYEIELMFEDHAQRPRDAYMIKFLLSNKKSSVIKLVDEINDECFELLKAEYSTLQIVSGITRVRKKE